jgi:hypothetical protein
MDNSVERVWVSSFGDRKELRVDFSNDFHFATRIEQPHGPAELAAAFKLTAERIQNSPLLNQ